MGLREDHSPLRDDGKQMATKEVGDDDDGSIGLLRRAVEEDLSAYPWFGRGWVFQELAPSKDPRIQCGERRLPWDDLLGVARPFLGRTEATRRLQALDAVHRSSSARSDKDLCSLILARRGSHVTDPRDLFFSLMGLASDRETYRKFLVPDYGKPARQVYIAAARYMKHKLGLSGFLHSAFARPAAKKSRALHLPSWVPDWEVQTIIPTAQETEETKSEPTVSSSEPLDKGALLLVEQIEEFGKVERLTDAFQRGASCFPPQLNPGKEGLSNSESDCSEWNNSIGPVKNTVTTVANPLEAPEWPEPDDARFHYAMAADPSQEPLPTPTTCRLALVVKHGGPDDIDKSSSTYYTVSVPVSVALGDSLISFKNPSFDTVRSAAREEDVIYGFRRPLKGSPDRITTEYGEAPLYELAGIHPCNLELITIHGKTHDRGSLIAFY
ncbi:hypothetical protein PG991_011202 [Apiospora marii]|uniref:Heterokaryon incompatibility domain-containing protein n=1 Tax=Apiospora marii TaxID=335849 RepID=A0ABR1RDH9_9PEZI